MKKLISLVLAMLMVLSLAACGNSAANNSTPPSEPPAQSEEPSQEPSEEPSEEPSTEPGGESEDVDLEAIWAEISELGEMPMLDNTPEEFLSTSYGIDTADLDAYVAKVPMMNVHATEFFIAKVKEGKMDAVKEALESHQGDLETTWATYLPDQYELVQNYQLVVSGDYILFAVSEYAEQAVEVFNNHIN